MGSLLDALSQENLDNQREVVKNEKRWSYDNRPYGTWNEKLLGAPVPGGPPVPPPDDRLDGGPRRRLARRRQGFFRTWYAPNNAVLSVVGRLRSRAGARVGGPVLRPDPGQPPPAATAGPLAPAADRRGAPRDRRGPRPAAARLHRVPGPGLRGSPARRPRHRHADPLRRQGEPPAQAAGPRGAAGPGRRGVHAAVRRRRLDHRGLGHRPAGRRHRGRRGRLPRGAGAAGLGGAVARRARAREGPHRGRRARRAVPRGGARRPAVDVRDAVRRPGARQHACCRATSRSPPSRSATRPATSSGPTTGSS